MRKCNASFYITYYITRDLFYTEAFTLEPRSSVKWFISCNQHYRNKRTLNTSYLWSPGTLMGCLDVSPLAPASGLRSTSTVVNFCSSSWYRAFSSRRTLCQCEHVLIYTYDICVALHGNWNVSLLCGSSIYLGRTILFTVFGRYHYKQLMTTNAKMFLLEYEANSQRKH